MPTFTYRARDLQGIDHKGTIETIDESSAARILSRKGLIITSLKEIKAGNQGSFFYKFLHRVSFDDLVVSTRQLATMINAGLVLSESIDILAEQQSNKTFQLVLSDISRDIKGGLDLASALRKHPDVFPPLYSSLIKAGEQAGNLDVILNQLATNLEKDREFKSRIKGALIYPVIVIIAMIIVMLIMLFYVIPKLTSLYTQSNLDLPLPTKILIKTSEFMVNSWYLLLTVLIVAVIVLRRWIATPEGRFKFDSFFLKVPLIGKIIKGANLTNFTRTFGLLATAGVPILDSLKIIKDVISNSVYKKAIEQTFQGIERGLTLSAQLQAVGVFPKIVPQMFRVGEETGKIDEVSFKMSEYFESETDHLVKNLTVAIEPLILIILGVGVGFLVLSIILPIYNLTSHYSG